MSSHRILYVLIALALAVLAALTVKEAQNLALGQSPQGPQTALKSTFPVTDPPQQFQLVQQVIDFPPGAWTPAHSHGGLVFVTIARGQVTQFSDGKDTVYQTGDTWTEIPGHQHQAGNTTSEPARDLVTFLLPPAAQQTISGQLPNAHDTTIKTSAQLSKFDVPAVARPFDLVQMQIDFAPGQWQPSHSYGGPAFALVLDGALTFRANGSDKTVKTGEGWTENPGTYSQVGNAGTTPASAFVTVLLPKGASLTMLQSQANTQAVTLPASGATLNAQLPGLGLIGALLIVGGGMLWRRNATRAR